MISSLPLRATVDLTRPLAPPDVRDAARGLRYRDFLTVALVLDGEDLFPDNWIYIHEPGVKVGRIQNYRSWSPWMVPDQSKACVGLEYFCFEGDELWDHERRRPRGARPARARAARPRVRSRRWSAATPCACPRPTRCTTATTSERVAAIRSWLETIANLQQVGRNGLHRYNNSDHSMLTAMRAVDNLVQRHDHDLWAVNAESVYHEEDVKEEHPYRDAPETPAMKQQQPVASET